MSHFCVLVAIKDGEGDWNAELERKLAPYQENNMGDCPEPFLSFFDKEDELEREYKERTIPIVQLADGRRFTQYDQQFKLKFDLNRIASEWEYPQGSELMDVPAREFYPTFEDFARDWHGYSERDEKTGRFGYWENQSAKWDFWSVGGRWSGLLYPNYDPHTDPRNQEKCSQCQGTGIRPGWAWFEVSYGDMTVKGTSEAVAMAVLQAEFEQGEVTLLHTLETQIKKVYKDSWAERCNGCNGCQGKGTRIKWPTQWVKIEQDSPLVRDVDFEALRSLELKEKLEQFDSFRAAYNAITWTEIDQDEQGFREDYESTMKRNPERCAKVFPTLQHFTHYKLAEEKAGQRNFFYTWDQTAELLGSREAYIEKYGGRALSFAFIDLEGQWIERGDMGWWGMSDDYNEDTYDQTFWQFIGSLEPTNRLVVVDCHT